jgi:hypothetical protein
MRLGVPLPFTGKSELVIMIEVMTEEMDRSDRVSFDVKRLRARLGLGNGNSSTRAKGRALRNAEGVCSKSASQASTLSEMDASRSIKLGIVPAKKTRRRCLCVLKLPTAEFKNFPEVAQETLA